MKSAKILTVAMASVLLLASCQQTSDPSVSTAQFSSWSEAFDSVTAERESSVAELEAERTVSLSVAQISEHVPYFDAPSDDGWMDFLFYNASYAAEQNVYTWTIVSGSYNEFSIESAFNDLQATLDAALEGNVLWVYDSSHEEYRATFDDVVYTVSVTYSTGYDLGITFDRYETPTTWGSYLNRMATYESAYNFSITIAEIIELIPFIPASTYEFNGPVYLSSSYLPFDEDGRAWGVGTSAIASQTTAQTEYQKIASSLAAAMAGQSEWTASTTSAGYTIYTRDYTSEDGKLNLIIRVVATVLTYTTTGEYCPSIVFDAERLYTATAWSDYFNSEWETESSSVVYALTAAEIDANVPFLADNFGLYIALSSYNSKYGYEYDAWGLYQNTTETGLSADLTALATKLSTVLTTEAGWTATALTSGYSFTKDITDADGNVTKTLYVDVWYTEESQVTGGYAILVTFDADNKLEITSWADYFATFSSYESSYAFAMPNSVINGIPYWESEYAVNVGLNSSLFTNGYSTWSIGATFADSTALTAGISAMNAELKSHLTGWTEETYGTATFYSNTISGTKYYIYVNYRTTNLAAYFVFDAAVTMTAWSDLADTYYGYNGDYYSRLVEYNYGDYLLATMAQIEEYVPFVDCDWDGLTLYYFTSSGTRLYYYAVTYTSDATNLATDFAAILAELTEGFGSSFTYDAENQIFERAISSTYGIAVGVIADESSNTIIVAFQLYSVTATA